MPRNDDTNIQNKIESLLRLAEDPEATPDEQQLAMERVHTLIAKYQVDASRLNPHSGQYVQEDIVAHTFEIPEIYSLGDLRHHGLYQVVQAMGADGYAHKNWNGRKYRREGFTVHATESTMQALTVLIPSLILQEVTANSAYIRTMRAKDQRLTSLQDAIKEAKAVGANPKKYQNKLLSEIRKHRKGFCLAFFVEAAASIKERRSDAVQRAGRGYDLVLVDTADRIARSLAELELSTSKLRKDSRFSAHGWENGTRAGREAMVGQTELHGGRKELSQ